MPILWLIAWILIRDRFRQPSIIFTALIFFLLFVLVITTFIDLEWKIIPNEATFSLMIAAFLFAPWNDFLSTAGLAQHISRSIIGFLTGGVGLWTIGTIGAFFFGKDAIGWGDIKLLAAIGAVLGSKGALLTLFAASFLGSIASITAIRMGVLKRRSYIPFGPFLSVGCLLVFVLMTLAAAAPFLRFFSFE